MAVTIAGILCQELVADYIEGFDIQGGPTCTKFYLCPWANRFTVAHGVLGLSSTSSLGGAISLNQPMAFPELAAESTYSLASMYARQIQIKGVGVPTQGANNVAWTNAIVGVTFGPFAWSFSGIDYMQLDSTRPLAWAEQHFAYSSEFITVPGRDVFYLSSGISLDQDWGFLSPLLDMTITLKNIPYLPAAAVLNALQAPINSVTYLGCGAGYIMFRGGNDDPVHSSDGTPLRDVSLRFTYRPIAPWDFVYNSANSGGTPPYWDQVVSAGNTPVIARSDLSLIIPGAYIA